MKVCAVLGFKIFYTIHNTYLWFSQSDWNNYRKTLKYCTKIFAVSDWVRDYFIRKTNIKNVITIENGIDVDSLLYGRPYTKKRKDFGLSKNDIVFVHLASINEAKYQMSLIGAMEKLITKYDNVYLFYLGNTLSHRYYALLRKTINKSLAKSRIRFVEYIPQIQIGDFLRTITDIQVLPSLYEGFPLSILEGLICKLPVITTSTGLPKGELENKVIFKIPNAYSSIDTLTINDVFKLSAIKNPRNVDILYEKMAYVASNLKEIKRNFNDQNSYAYDVKTMVNKYMHEMFN
jgi:glycosyltransferase involved in cell wall biosynthesis